MTQIEQAAAPRCSSPKRPLSLAQVLLGVFASNSINILAGVNGLEAGQTLIIACAVLLHNLMQVCVNRVPYKPCRLLASHSDLINGLSIDSNVASQKSKHYGATVGCECGAAAKRGAG